MNVCPAGFCPHRSRRVACGMVFALLLAFIGFVGTARAQDNYEIQVYGSDTVAPKTIMVETHTNFSSIGSKPQPNSKFSPEGVYASDHAERETLELTQGINHWSEVGFYVFTNSSSANGFQWVGDHIRPRVRVPDDWNWPVGASLSMEIGYQRRSFSPDTWTWEIRPIVDKHFGRWYTAVNPVLERSFHGASVHQGVTFAPAVEIGYDITRKVTANIEYYGAFGQLGDFAPLHDQQHQIFPSLDLNVSPEWELNFGVGIGATASTDHLILKAIIGRRFNWTGRRPRGTSKGDEGKPENP